MKKLLKSTNLETVKLTRKLILKWKKIVSPVKTQKIQNIIEIDLSNDNSIDINNEKDKFIQFNNNSSLKLADKLNLIKEQLNNEEKNQIRKNTKVLIFETLATSKKKSQNKDNTNSEEDDLMSTGIYYSEYMKDITLDIENNIYKNHFECENSKYLKQVKAIILNIHNSTSFLRDILSGKLTGEMISVMTPEDMASEEIKLKRQKLKEDSWNSRRSDWYRIRQENSAKPGMYRCGKCRNNLTTSYQVQIRRADEPMTTFVNCLKCDHKWRQ